MMNIDLKLSIVDNPGQVVRTLRAASGLNQLTAARLAGVAPETLCRIEKEAHRPKPETLRKILSALKPFVK